MTLTNCWNTRLRWMCGPDSKWFRLRKDTRTLTEWWDDDSEWFPLWLPDSFYFDMEYIVIPKGISLTEWWDHYQLPITDDDF